MNKKELMKQLKVAPRVGVWIEMNNLNNKFSTVLVAPRVGVWIEILYIYVRFL